MIEMRQNKFVCIQWMITGQTDKYKWMNDLFLHSVEHAIDTEKMWILFVEKVKERENGTQSVCVCVNKWERKRVIVWDDVFMEIKGKRYRNNNRIWCERKRTGNENCWIKLNQPGQQCVWLAVCLTASWNKQARSHFHNNTHVLFFLLSPFSPNKKPLLKHAHVECVNKSEKWEENGNENDKIRKKKKMRMNLGCCAMCLNSVHTGCPLGLNITE